MDYRRFLAKNETLTFPWLLGDAVWGEGRRFRLARRPEQPGWYRFETAGRTASVVERCDAGDLTSLPRVRGWLLGDRLVCDQATTAFVWLLPAEEPPAFSPVTARRWHSGDLLFDALEFETEAEGALREALATEGALASVKGVAAPLRAAYVFALVDRVGRRLGIRGSPQEVRHRVVEIAEGGALAAEAVLRALETERELARRQTLEEGRRQREQAVRDDVAAEHERRVQVQQRERKEASERAEEVLAEAGALMESVRRLEQGRLEVVFRFMGERFVALVEALTLQIVDAGICLSGADRVLTLDSLPAVIKEAIDTDRLVITRHP